MKENGIRMDLNHAESKMIANCVSISHLDDLQWNSKEIQVACL